MRRGVEIGIFIGRSLCWELGFLGWVRMGGSSFYFIFGISICFEYFGVF